MADTLVLAYVGLGANLGDVRASLTLALHQLGALPFTELVKVSSFYRSAPVGADGPDYINAVASLQTALAPTQLLTHLHQIEALHGRQRPYNNAPRTLDLDLLLYGELTLQTHVLTLPHPRVHERAFVLLPMAEIAPPGCVIPGWGQLSSLLPGVSTQVIQRVPIQ